MSIKSEGSEFRDLDEDTGGKATSPGLTSKLWRAQRGPLLRLSGVWSGQAKQRLMSSSER